MDCIILILEDLEFGDLLNAAQINQNFNLAAQYVFKLKNAKKPIQIEDTFKYPQQYEPIYVGDLKIGTQQIAEAIELILNPKKTKYVEYNNTIYITDYQTMLDTFKFLKISNLDIVLFNHEDRHQARLLGQLISNYSTESLNAITFESRYYNPLEFITQPLVNVRNVTFYSDFHLNCNLTLTMNEMFPSISALFLMMEATDLVYFNCHMPHLKYIYFQTNTVGDDDSQYLASNISFAHILANNQQIESIKTDYVKSEYLLAASQMPNLKNFTVVNFRDRTVQTRFETVTKFTSRLSARAPQSFYFPNLEIFRLELTTRAHLTLWTNFLRRHNHITVLHLEHSRYNREWNENGINYSLGETMVALPNLREMTLTCQNWYDFTREYGVNAIIELLTTNENLNIFELIFDQMDDWEMIRASFEQIDGQWLINDTPNGMLFERL